MKKRGQYCAELRSYPLTKITKSGLHKLPTFLNMRQGNTVNKRGQVSVELTVVLAVLLIFLLVVIVYAMSYLSSSQLQVRNEIAADSLLRVSQAANRVYLQGNNSLEVVYVDFPANTNQSIVDQSLIGIILLRTATSQSQILRDTGVPVAGTLPSSGGVYAVNVTSNGTSVLLSYS